VFDVKTSIHAFELVLVVPWDQSSLSVGFPRVWQRYPSMTGDQTIPSLVRHQPIYSPETGLYLSAWHEDPRTETPLIGATAWVAYFGDHCLLCTLMADIICPWPYYLHDDIDPRCTVLVAMLLSCLSRSHGSAVYWSAAMLYLPRAWECPPREDSYISDMRTLVYGCRYPRILSSTPPSSDPTVFFSSIFSSTYSSDDWLSSILRPSVPSDLAH